MGRKEYFECIENLKMMRNEVVNSSEDSTFEGVRKTDYLRNIDQQLEEVKSLVNQ